MAVGGESAAGGRQADLPALVVALAAADGVQSVLSAVGQYLAAQSGRAMERHAIAELFGAVGRLTGLRRLEDPVFLDRLNMAQRASMSGPEQAFTSVTGAFAGSFQDPAKGHEIASQMYQSGVDYIQTDSAATDTGIIQAANEGDGRMVSAISPQQYKIGPKTVAALVALDFGQSLYNEVTKALGPDFKGGHVHTGLGTGVIDFVLSPVFQEQGPKDLVAKAKEVWPDIEKAKADIISGALKVEFKTAL